MTADHAPATIPTPLIELEDEQWGHLLRTRQWLPRPIEEVFAFHADAENLQRITPPSMRFHVVSAKPVEMRVGALIDYRLKVRGIPLRWRSEIVAWEPPHRFVDQQVRGPYRLWWHEHTFEATGGGTIVRDLVRYRALGGGLVNRVLVAPDLRRIFAYRQQQFRMLFGS